MSQKNLKKSDKQKNSFHPTTLFQTKSKGVFLGDSLLKKECAYEIFLTNNPHLKPEPVTKPLPREVIDLILDTMILSGEEKGDFFKQRLKEGLLKINEKSLTGRALIRMVRLFQGVDTSMEMKTTIACVFGRLDVIFFNKKMCEKLSAFELATTFLHETDHLLDSIQLRPFFESAKGYFDKQNKPITGEEGSFSNLNRFVLHRLFEAEKQAQTYQICAEMQSVGGYFSSLLRCLKEAYFNLFFIKTSEKSIEEKALLGYQTKYLFFKMKRLLNPAYWFLKKEEKEKSLIKEAQKQMASHICFLLSPKKTKKINLFSCLGLLASLTGFMTISLFQAPVLSLSMLLAAGCCCALSVADKAYVTARNNWCDVYNKNAYHDACKNEKLKQGSKKKYRLILKTFQEKYQFFLKRKELEKSRTDLGQFEQVFQSKKELGYLSLSLQKDVVLLANLVEKYDEKTKACSDWWVHEFISKAKPYMKAKTNAELEWAVLTTLYTRLLKTNVFDEVIKKASIEEGMAFQSVYLRNAFFAKLKELGLKNEHLPVLKQTKPVRIKKQKQLKKMKQRGRAR